jgi:hypothetical protein
MKNVLEPLVEQLSDERRLKIQIFRDGVAGAVERRAAPRTTKRLFAMLCEILGARAG